MVEENSNPVLPNASNGQRARTSAYDVPISRMREANIVRDQNNFCHPLQIGQ